MQFTSISLYCVLMLVQIKIIIVFIDLQLVAEIPKFGFGHSLLLLQSRRVNNEDTIYRRLRRNITIFVVSTI